MVGPPLTAEPVTGPPFLSRDRALNLISLAINPSVTRSHGDVRPGSDEPAVHTAPGRLCPWRHSQAVEPLWFGRTLTQYLIIIFFMR